MNWSGAIQPARFLSHTGKVLPGVRRVVQVPEPAAGADWTVTVPGGMQWYILSGTATLTTSATVDNRQPVITETVDGVTIWPGLQSLSFGASTTKVIPVLLDGGFVSGAATEGDIFLAAPSNLLPPGTVIASDTALLQVGDQWSAISLWVEEVYVTDNQLSEIARLHADLEYDIEKYEYQQAMQGQGGT